MDHDMPRKVRLFPAFLFVLILFAPAASHAGGSRPSHPRNFQETGFLNRSLTLRGSYYRFQVYLPTEWRRDDHRKWPIILFLHGRGERGSEGMWQTQIGLPEAVRDHPDRWPFIIVMPQCPWGHYWTDPDMLAMAMATLDQEADEFHADPERTYLTGLSLGGYGAWELARDYPRRWAAIAIMSSGIFWSYAPQRWREVSTLPASYARAVGRTPVWVFHGSLDTTVPVREDDVLFDAFKTAGGHFRYWLYQGLRHDSWSRAYNEPELPRWLLSHHRDARQVPPPLAERLIIPQHPLPLRLTGAQLDAFTGDYLDEHGQLGISLFRQGEQLYQKDVHGEVTELAAETLSSLFFPNGSSIARIAVERDAQGRVAGLTFRDDRHEERWRRGTPPPR